MKYLKLRGPAAKENGMIKKISSWIDGLKPISAWDVLFYGLIAVFCFFSFNHPDILHAGGSSFTLLKGHLADFYEANAGSLPGGNYLISTYILFALWNLPVYLLKIVREATMNVGYVVFWYKALTTLFFMASAVVMYRIGRATGLSEKNSKILTAFWISSPLLFFSQFIFGQHDIITVFFTLLGTFYYLKKNRALFVLFFGISMTFKYFPFFVFVPLLLLAEKKPLALMRDTALFLLPIALVYLPYANSGQFISNVAGFNVLDRAFSAGFQLESEIKISVFTIAWIIICSAAYLKKPENAPEFSEWSMYLSMASSSLFFALIFWHPQWLPFLAITTFRSKKPGFYMLLDFLVMIPFIVFTVNFWAMSVDQSLWKLGIFKGLLPHPIDQLATVFMKNLFVFYNRTILFSIISSYFLLNVFFKFPSLPGFSRGNDGSQPDIRRDMPAARLRFFGGILVFIIPAVLSIILSSGRGIFYDTTAAPGVKFGPGVALKSGSSISQVFTANCRQVTAFAVKLTDYCALQGQQLGFSLSELQADGKPGRVLLEGPVSPPADLKESDYFAVTVENTWLQPGKEYIFTFEPAKVKDGCLVLWRTSAPAAGNKSYAIAGGSRLQYDLVFKLYGKK